MKVYYVNKNPQDNGDHEVHEEGCFKLPKYENRLFLGYFSNCKDAVKEARKYYTKVNGCYYCSIECHTT
jgi:hypothetical protein